MRQIVVVGSLNMDLVVRTARLPLPGQTIRGDQLETIPGGKGANQAVAAARLASPDTSVSMVGRVGEDGFGEQLRASLGGSGVRLEAVKQSPGPTGIAIIAVEESGENFIIIAAGANGLLTREDLDEVAPLLRGADALLLQLEVPLPVVEHAARLAAEGGALVILNPAPAPDSPLPASLLRHVSLLVANETETMALTGEPEHARAAAALRALNVETVIVTLGEQGALLLTEQGEEAIPSFKIVPVDTTAAGDAFAGALAVALVEGSPLPEAVRFACGAGALAATRAGAQPSLPTRAALTAFLQAE